MTEEFASTALFGWAAVHAFVTIFLADMPLLQMDKKECIKNINNSLERILEDFIEILALLKVVKGTRLEEMESLVFSKRRMADLTENAQRIFQNLVALKHFHRNSSLTYKREQPMHGFDYLSKLYSEDFAR